MKTTRPKASKKSGGLTSAVPVRFDESDRAIIADLKKRTGLSAADVVRRSVRYAGPKFSNGSANIADLTDSKAA